MVWAVTALTFGGEIRGLLSFISGPAELTKLVDAGLARRQNQRGYRIARNIFRKTTARTGSFMNPFKCALNCSQFVIYSRQAGCIFTNNSKLFFKQMFILCDDTSHRSLATTIGLKILL